MSTTPFGLDAPLVAAAAILIYTLPAGRQVLHFNAIPDFRSRARDRAGGQFQNALAPGMQARHFPGRVSFLIKDFSRRIDKENVNGIPHEAGMDRFAGADPKSLAGSQARSHQKPNRSIQQTRSDPDLLAQL